MTRRNRQGAVETVAVIQRDAASPWRVFEGNGAVRAGASTPLLKNYPEPQRAPSLDFLFKPGFGAGFQHLAGQILVRPA